MAPFPAPPRKQPVPGPIHTEPCLCTIPVLDFGAMGGNHQSERKTGKRQKDERREQNTVSLFEKNKTKLAIQLGREDSSTGTFNKTKCRRKVPGECT